jgi:hypothetical protein
MLYPLSLIVIARDALTPLTVARLANRVIG